MSNSRQTLFGKDARAKLQAGVDHIANAVKVTLGAKGRHVIIATNYGSPHPTKDGVTVARSINSADPVENIGADMIREVAAKTVDLAGDGTTTATVIAQELIKGCIKAVDEGASPIEIKAEIEAGVKKVVARLGELSKRVETGAQLINIGTISANNDPVLGGLIADVIRKVGKDGSVTVENSTSGKDEILVFEGMKVESGLVDPHFVTNFEKMKAEHYGVNILLCEDEISFVENLMPALDVWNSQSTKKPLLIVAKEINGDALGTLVHSKIKNGLQVCAIKVPGMGSMRGQILDDIAAVTGATVISEDRGLHLKDTRIEHFGFAGKIISDKKQTIIVDGRGNPEVISERCSALKTQMEDSKGNEKEVIKQRLASISNGVAVVYVSGITDGEIKEKKDRIDDAICATKAALEEGFVAGGGTAYLEAAKVLGDSTGEKILLSACLAPFEQGLDNAGIKGRPNFEYGSGINALNGLMCNLFDAGIIDPTKVSRVALENAASVACLILTTECVSYEEVEVRK